VRPCRVTGGSATHGTTARQNTHGTEVVVCYPWHPWHGLTVRVVRSLAKRRESMVHATAEGNKRAQVLEIPGWMVDPGACASLRAAQEPAVDCSALRSLRELLKCIAVRTDEPMIEDQHLVLQSKGDADASTSASSPPRPARGVPGSAVDTTVCSPPTRCETASSTVAGTVALGTLHRTPWDKREGDTR
jgi:hypothetical protein